MIGQIIAAIVGTISFSVLFQVQRRHWVYCGITGGVGWLIYLLLMRWTSSPAISTFIATVALSALSRLFSARYKTPTTVFLFCGIFTLVPGAGIYYTAYHFFLSTGPEAAAYALSTVKAAIAIALGISVGYSLPQRWFGWKSKSVIWNFLNRE